MSTPIGHIEFLVKFDTMSQGFEKALRDAVQDIDVRVSGGFGWDERRRLTNIADNCKEILYLIRERLRTPFTSSYQSFLAGVMPEISFAKSEETKKRLADILRTSPTGKRLFGPLSQEDAEEHAEDILNQYRIRLERALVRKVYEKDKEKIVNLQTLINQILMGSWKAGLEKFIQQVSDEKFLGEQYRKILKRFGIEAEFKPREWGVAQERIEYGKYRKIEKTRLPVKSFEDVIKMFESLILEYDLQVHAEKIFKRFFAGDPTFKKIELPSLFRRFGEKFLTKSDIFPGTPLPPPMWSLLGQLDPKLKLKRGRGPRRDFFFTVTQEQLDKMEKVDEFLDRHFETESYMKGLKQIGIATFFGRFKDVMGRAGTMKELGGVPQLTKEEIAALSSEKLVETFHDELKHIRESLDHLIDITESEEQKRNLESIKRGIDELTESRGAPRTPKER